MAFGADLEAIKGDYDKLKSEEEQSELGGDVQVCSFASMLHLALRLCLPVAWLIGCANYVQVVFSLPDGSEDTLKVSSLLTSP